LIGENINEELVAAIESAPEPAITPAEITEASTEEEARANEAAALDDLAREESPADALQSDDDVQRE
jgi:hypothetical protein